MLLLTVGKLRAKWLPQTVGEVGLSALKAIKREFDPTNIFASGNLFADSAKL
jgi:FAD/FMN-containing dehydrogenase